jgi:hypothetical protein
MVFINSRVYIISVTSTKCDLRETELRLRFATLEFVVWTACVGSTTVVGAVFTMLK